MHILFEEIEEKNYGSLKFNENPLEIKCKCINQFYNVNNTKDWSTNCNVDEAVANPV